MAPKSVLILLLVAVAAALAQKQCCYPTQFEGILSSIIGTVESGHGSVQNGGYQFAYDYTNLRLGAIELDPGSFSNIQYIFDYGKGVEYVLQNKSSTRYCTKLTLNETMPHCLPASATYIGSYYFGDHQLSVDSFHYFEPKGPSDFANVTVSASGDCIPFSIVTQGLRGGVPTLSVRGYANYTKGIRDPYKYFNVPRFCLLESDSETPKMQNSLFDKILP